MNTVRQLLKMKGNEVLTVSPETTILEGLKLMAEKGTGSLVIAQGEAVLGIFTERDYARKVGQDGRTPGEIRVSEVMTASLITVRPEQSVRECMVLMTDNHIRHLPVMEKGRLIGIISIGDVVKDLIEELEFMVDQLKNYIAGLS